MTNRFFFGVVAGICLIAFGCSARIAVNTKSDDSIIPVTAEANAADIVRAVRQNEDWIGHVDSLFLRIEGKWIRTPEDIARSRAALEKKFPDTEPNIKRFPELNPSPPVGTIEYAIERNRIRFSKYEPDRRQVIRIWDGKSAYAHEKTFNTDWEHYGLANTPREFFQQVFAELSWLKFQPYSFWWGDVDSDMNFAGRPEDFRITGQENYKGHDCYILEYKVKSPDNYSPVNLAFRWDVGVKDRLLYRIIMLRNNRPEVEFWTLDYKEVAPGCLLPMTQGHKSYRSDPTKKSVFVAGQRDLKVVEVRVNEKLSDELFRMEFKEGVQVTDYRLGGLVDYPYKENRTDEEWKELREKAHKQAEQEAELMRWADVRRKLIGKPAPDFPANSRWLNSGPLTLKDLRGKVVILDFWAESCGACRSEPAVMGDLHNNRGKSGIVAIGVHTAGGETEDINKIMKQYKADYPVCIDVNTHPPEGRVSWGQMFDKYAIYGIPCAFVIDQQGNIAGWGGSAEDVVEMAKELAENQSGYKPDAQAGR